MEYLFVLGRQPEISLTEIISLLEKTTAGFSVNLLGSIAVVGAEKKLDADFLVRRLGGTVKIAAVRKTVPADSLAFGDIAELAKTKSGGGKKISFGLSAYNRLSEKKIKKLGLGAKKILLAEGQTARFVFSRGKILSSAAVKINKLLTAGVEIVIAEKNGIVFLAETLAVQPFAEFSERDFGRPARDARSGMLPPKLARIMINLAGAGADAAILDPFCGSGTILTEAALMGYKNAIGSDINPQAVKDARQNLKWLNQKFQIPDFKFLISNVRTRDARKLSQFFAPRSIDAVITEPYLGPPLKGNESANQVRKTARELSALYEKSLDEFKKILTGNGTVVMIWPVFLNGGEKIFIPLIEKIKKTGWKISPLLPADHAGLLTPRQTLIYARPGQKVAREIIKLKAR